MEYCTKVPLVSRWFPDLNLLFKPPAFADCSLTIVRKQESVSHFTDTLFLRFGRQTNNIKIVTGILTLHVAGFYLRKIDTAFIYELRILG